MPSACSSDRLVLVLNGTHVYTTCLPLTEFISEGPLTDDTLFDAIGNAMSYVLNVTPVEDILNIGLFEGNDDTSWAELDILQPHEHIYLAADAHVDLIDMPGRPEKLLLIIDIDE